MSSDPVEGSIETTNDLVVNRALWIKSFKECQAQQERLFEWYNLPEEKQQ